MECWRGEEGLAETSIELSAMPVSWKHVEQIGKDAVRKQIESRQDDTLYGGVEPKY